MNLSARTSSWASALALALASLAGGCSTPHVDLAAWRARESAARPAEQRGAVDADVASADRLRAEDKLADARRLALQLAAEHPDDGRVLLLASRAESDGVLLFPEDDKESRNHAAASALDYAECAAQHGQDSAAAQAQLAWALGTTTHLQSMGDRSAHARRTKETAEHALAQDADNATALATLAVVNLRLQTLPWIANLMASGLPESSLAEAERCARRAVAAVPSRENKQILAKVLIALERKDEARTVLEEALATGARFPRDHALETPLRKLLADL
jgi:tetratricopeptide (TPR) repeat protein